MGSLDELSISEPESEPILKFHPEPQFFWNEGDVTTNAISEPWSFVNPYYIPIAVNGDFNEESDDDSDMTVEDQNLLTRLPQRLLLHRNQRSDSYLSIFLTCCVTRLHEQ